MPETGETEKLTPTTPKSLWYELLMRYKSGVPLVGLNKFNLIKNGKINLMDRVDKAVNASKVFSIPEKYVQEKKVKKGYKIRRNRQGKHLCLIFLEHIIKLIHTANSIGNILKAYKQVNTFFLEEIRLDFTLKANVMRAPKFDRSFKRIS